MTSRKRPGYTKLAVCSSDEDEVGSSGSEMDGDDHKGRHLKTDVPTKKADSLNNELDSSNTTETSDSTYPSDFDDFLVRTIGQFGRYQKFLVFLLCIPACFISAFGTFDLVFMIYKPEFKCNIANRTDSHENTHFSNISDWPFPIPPSIPKKDQCTFTIPGLNKTENVTSRCNSFTYSEEFMRETVVSKWNLVCDRELMGRTYFSALNFATLPAMIYSFIQDKYGRKKAFLMNLFVYVLFGAASVLVSEGSLEVFIVLKFFSGILCMWEICFCWALEFIGGTKQRTLVTTIMSVVYGVANLTLALIAWLCRDWRLIGLCTSLPFSLTLFFICLVPESPRWLLAENRIDELLNIVCTIGKRQGVKLDPDHTRKLLTGLRRNIEAGAPVHEPNIWDFFRSKNLLAKSAVMTFIIVVTNQLYGAIPYDAENLSKNIFIGYTIPVLFEMPATLINLYFVNKLGRVVPLTVFQLISGFCCLLAWPLGDMTEWASVVLAGLARFFVSAALGVQEQFAEELYPTVGRGVGTSISYVASALTGFGLQYLIYAAVVFKALPLVIMGALTVMSGLLTLLLPDTTGLPLPDTLVKAEAQGAVGWKSLRKNLRMCCAGRQKCCESSDDVRHPSSC